MSQKIRIKLKSYDHNLVDKSAEDRKDSEGYRCGNKRTDPPAYTQTYLYSQPLDFRQQEVA